MIRSMRASLALAATLSLAAAFGAAVALPLPHAPSLPFAGEHTTPKPLKLKPGEWPQAHSDVQADPEIRFGALPNGMRYAIKRQTVPAGQAAVRFWFDAGSLDETDAQQGLAHFLEHMAFKGSKQVPENQMIPTLQRLGLAFGPDTNAMTQFDQTIYQLDLPHTDDQTVDTALMLMRETASNLSLKQDAMDHERGVVLSEERARDTPNFRVFKSSYAFLLPGQRPPLRYPIGKVDVLKNAPVTQIADFYHRYYRPERAALVIVGDLDPAAVEAKIKARFSDWQATGPAGPDPDLGKVKPRGLEAKVTVEPGAQLGVQMSWLQPPDLSPDTLKKRRRDFLRLLGRQVMGRRFQAMARAADPPFLYAGVVTSDNSHAADQTTVLAGASPGKWKPALEAIERETRRAIQYGVRQDELDREIVEARALLKARAAGAATRKPSEIADDIVGALKDQEVVTNPSQDLAFFESVVKGLKAEEVSAELKTLFRGSGPLVFVSSPTLIDGGDQAVLAAMKASRQTEVTPPAAAAQVTWPYDSFGPAGKVAESRDVSDLETTLVRFENGVRLTVKPTKFRDDEVLVRVNLGQGLRVMARDRQGLNWASGAFTEGGLKQISTEDMDRVLADKVYGARFGVGEESFTLSGSTRREDLATELQVLAAYATEPGWRPQAFDRLKNSMKILADQYEQTDSGILSRDLSGLIHGGDRRYTFPSRDEVATAKLADLQALVAPHLASDPIEVVIVGDVSVEQATQLVARTFGALPPRQAGPAPTAEQLRTGFPAATAQPHVLLHKGRADQSIAFIAWPAPDFWADPNRARADAVMGEVMGLRLIEQLRNAQGATYSPSVSYNHSTVWPGWGYVSAMVEVPPQKIDGFFADVQKIAADLAAKGPTADELERAKKPRIDTLKKDEVTNQFWLGQLSGAQTDPRKLDFIRQLVPGTERVSAADVQAAARATLDPAKAWKLVVKSQSAGK